METSEYNNDSKVYNTNYLDTVSDFINAIVSARNEIIRLFGILISGPCDYIVTSSNGSSRQGINQSYWTTFIRVIKRTYGDCRDCQESRGGV